MDDDRLITLVCPFGAENAAICSHGVGFVPYREDIHSRGSRWLVDVTPQAAHNFLHNGGFALPDFVMRRQFSGQTAPLVHKDGAFSIGFDGQQYQSEETRLPNGEMRLIADFPLEAIPEVVGVFPGFSVLSMVEFQAPPATGGEGEASASKGRRSKRDGEE
jgi:hypothetical protein